MKNIQWSFAETGRIHQQVFKSCEDKAINGDMQGMRYIALADGAGSLKYCAEGAQCSVKAIAEYVSENFDRLLYEDTQKVKYIIMNHILFSLKKSAGIRDIKEFGSTLLFVGVKNGKYILFHQGDGTIFANSTHGFKNISSPMNGISSQYTYLTTTHDGYKYARLLRGENIYNMFLLCSDGCDEILAPSRRTIRSEIMYMLYKDADIKTVKDYIKNNGTPTDDYSVSFMKI